MHVLYNIAIYSYWGFIYLASLFNPKAKLWIKGRKGIWKKLEGKFLNREDVIWFHAASLGEFEQGRPVIEAYRKKHPKAFILLTFFSPSGYEIRKNYQGADVVFYLPMDTPTNARRFISIVKPQKVIFIKYEFWFNYFRQLHDHHIPSYIISANFRKDQHFFKTYGTWFRKQLQLIDGFFVQNESSAKLLQFIGISKVFLSGDTRFDRVVEISKLKKSFPLVEKFSLGHNVLLAGSSWPSDEKLLHLLFSAGIDHFKLIIAPHEIGNTRIKTLRNEFSSYGAICYSTADENSISQARVLIIDGMGFLSGLYQYCRFAYIGGGFGKGIHNILEAAAFAKPVVFGPNYQKFSEANELVQRGGAFAIDENNFLSTCTSLFKGSEQYQKAAEIARKYIDEKQGATLKILEHI